MSDFVVTPSRPSGSSRCRECLRVEAAELRAKKPELQKAADAKYRKRHPEKYKAVQKKSKAQYYAKNAEVLKVKIKAWGAANPEKVRLAKKLNKGKRRAKVKGNHVPSWVVRRLFDLFERQCAYCRNSPAVHLDHIMPLAKGGEHKIENLAPACARCNQSKNARLPEEFEKVSGYNVQAVINKVKGLN